MGNTHSYLKMNYLHQGDNLTILRNMPDASVDLICTDPPFNTGKDWGAFSDKWEGGLKGYLKFMEARVVEMRRVLKSTGSLYLHCDPTASHYLKVMLDIVFGIDNFRNEIVWQRKRSQALKSNSFGRTNDTILLYSKSDDYTFNPLYTKDDTHTQKYIKDRFRFDDGDGRKYMKSPLVNPANRPNQHYEFYGVKPPERGWLFSKDRMESLYKNNELVMPNDCNARIYRKIYLDTYKGQLIQNIWVDIPIVNPMAKERLGYPTQKPVALYERMIKASSNQGDIVLDPFAGSGTTLDAAHTLGRHWIGIDIGDAAIETIQDRHAEPDTV